MRAKLLAITCVFLAQITLAEWAHPNISQAVFAKNVINRTPIDIITEADNHALKKVYFFTNIRHLKGDTITHRWLYNDKIKAEIDFDIRGNRWRVWSSKNIWRTWTGLWTVEVVDGAGEILLTEYFIYEDAHE